MGNDLIAYNDIERIGTVIAKSKLFGMKTPEEAIALCLIAQAEGKHPATAAMEYNVIQGKPALKADAMLARFQAAGGKVAWGEYTDKRVSGVFSHPQGGSVEIVWSIEMATKLGFHIKDNWKKFPRAMMRARCISEGVRTVYPGIAVGVYTPEEVQDFDNTVEIKPYEVDETKAASPWKTAILRNNFGKDVQLFLQNAQSAAEANSIIEGVKEKLDLMRASGDERDMMVVDSIQNVYRALLVRLKQPKINDISPEEGGLTSEELAQIEIENNRLEAFRE